MSHTPHEQSRTTGTVGTTLAVGALGVVFGDIGTSPLYTMQEVFIGPHNLSPDPQTVYGAVSLVFWALMIIVTLKYVMLIMRADNKGEGGIMALVALVQRVPSGARRKAILVALGVLGASLFYGDGMITPAISVLSAVEGLKVAAPGIEPLVVPIALVIIIALFFIQRFGTARVGAMFGPVMLVWFVILATLGTNEVVRHPGILRSLSPVYAVEFFAERGVAAFLALGSVVLAVTGGEALYADMGHFGRTPITRAWLLVALPALLLNYMGQGALLVSDPSAARSPFYLLAPQWAQLPMVVMATIATVIASQSVISGTFSVTRQAIQLGFLPRMSVRHTSSRAEGQIYVPTVNWVLLVSVVMLILGFRSSTHLASAYGIAVTATFTINTVLAFYVFRTLWRRPLWLVIPGAVFFLVVELAFFTANLTKILHGGWFPIVMALAVFTLLITWRQGRDLTARRLAAREMPLKTFIQLLRAQSARDVPGIPVQRVPGTGVYLTAYDGGTPTPLVRNVEHNHVLHKNVVLFTSKVENIPRVPHERRVEVTRLNQGIVRVVAHYGFQEQPDVPAALRLVDAMGVEIDEPHASYFLGHFTLSPVDDEGMALWRKKLFAAMSKNSYRASTYLGVPSDRVVEIGTQVDI